MYKNHKGLKIPDVSEVRENFEAVGTRLSLSSEHFLQCEDSVTLVLRQIPLKPLKHVF